MGSTVIAIPDGEEVAIKETKKFRFSLLPLICFLGEKKNNIDVRKLMHSIKVGIALVLVSLLYLLDPLYEQVGDNAMWAIMTVVVIFEFFAGATLSKGLNRGIGTILGGGLGCLAAILAQEVGGIGNAVIVGILVFIFGAAATYTRLVPRIKARYDYGAMIFLLTFNLVAVSGIRAEEKVMQLTRERLSTIVMGFVICIFTSLLVFPIWASDELHESVASRFSDLAAAIDGCLKEFFRLNNDVESQTSFSFDRCKSVLHAKSKDESLVNFARWEPWHGKFGFYHPWNKYLEIAELLGDLAAIILSIKGCLQCPKECSRILRELIKEPFEGVGSSITWILRELGESIMKMKRCHSGALLVPKLKTVRQELSLVMPPSKLGQLESANGLAIGSFLFSLMEMVDKVEELAKEVEKLGELAGFHSK